MDIERGVIGALLRPSLKRTCFKLGLDYQDDGGWLDSAFIVRGPKPAMDQLRGMMRAMVREEQREREEERRAEEERRKRWEARWFVRAWRYLFPKRDLRSS